MSRPATILMMCPYVRVYVIGAICRSPPSCTAEDHLAALQQRLQVALVQEQDTPSQAPVSHSRPTVKVQPRSMQAGLLSSSVPM